MCNYPGAQVFLKIFSGRSNSNNGQKIARKDYLFFVYFSDMDIEHYDDIQSSADHKTFSFISIGPKGDLMKFVKFSAFPEIPNAHNLGLGTMRGKIIDYSEMTDNNDRGYHYRYHIPHRQHF
jgi:hypothetical protein